jgi:type II secretion system protein E
MSKKTDLVLARALAEKGLITQKDIDFLLTEAESANITLEQVIIQRRLLPERDILKILSEKIGLALVDLKTQGPDKSVIAKVPVKIATYYKFFPVQIKDRLLTVAVSSPLDLKVQDEIRTQLGLDIAMALASSDDIADALKKHYGFAADTLEKMVAQAPGAVSQTSDVKVEDLERLAEDASVIRLVNQIILDAWRKRATDIHIEPYRSGLALRYRVDGLLYEANVPPDMNKFLNAIISRIKIMSNLNIVERRLPQDGRAVVKVQEQLLDLRISTMPTPYGESVVVRILPTQMLFSLEKLGLSKKDLQVFEQLIQKPHGIIFVTGPTGSGKTTTLYACLSRINTKERKIITIEDPIEYEMTGVTQIQVMPEIGFDFARGLRSILRHDPDVIMVGEVRDLETAEIAIRVALTGHLVFSTLHTNDAASGITRLVDIGLEPYLVASSIEAFIAQRLIRVICPECKVEDTGSPRELKEMIARDLKLRSAADIKIFRGKGCNSCNGTGFFGRTAIYEILVADDPVKDLIVKKATAQAIKRLALASGMRTLRQDGWQKVVSGITTPEEVMKVTSVEKSADQTQPVSEKEEGPIFFSSIVSPDFADDPGGMYAKGLERRIYRRLLNTVNIRYRVVKDPNELDRRGQGPEQHTVTKDVSASGLLFLATEALAVGVIIELKIELPGMEEAIECLARVVRTEEGKKERTYYCGACFLDISGADRSRLNKYVESELTS